MDNMRKVLFTNGMSDEYAIIITDAPKKEIEKWCYRYNEEMENNFDSLKVMYFVRELVDSEVDEYDRELIEIVGYDEVYDLCDYYM